VSFATFPTTRRACDSPGELRAFLVPSLFTAVPAARAHRADTVHPSGFGTMDPGKGPAAGEVPRVDRPLRGM
jgi:hypothetical protein